MLSTDPIGKLVLNTAISRAKSHLRFYLDAGYWSNLHADELLTEITQ